MRVRCMEWLKRASQVFDHLLTLTFIWPWHCFDIDIALILVSHQHWLTSTLLSHQHCYVIDIALTLHWPWHCLDIYIALKLGWPWHCFDLDIAFFLMILLNVHVYQSITWFSFQISYRNDANWEKCTQLWSEVLKVKKR